MKKNITQQEVLLITGTGFSSRQYCENDDGTGNSKNLSENEKLKEACWNGLLKDILPEVFLLSGPEAKLYLWQMREALHFFALEMGEQPSEIDIYFSIDPYSFMEMQAYN